MAGKTVETIWWQDVRPEGGRDKKRLTQWDSAYETQILQVISLDDHKEKEGDGNPPSGVAKGEEASKNVNLIDFREMSQQETMWMLDPAKLDLSHLRNSVSDSESNRSLSPTLSYTEIRGRDKRKASVVDDLLCTIYTSKNAGGFEGGGSECSHDDTKRNPRSLTRKSLWELSVTKQSLLKDLDRVAALLVQQLRQRDRLLNQRECHYDVITAILQAASPKRSQDTNMRFGIEPIAAAGDSGFGQWHDAMRMVARLPGGVPPEFRRRLWLTLAEQHIANRGVRWHEIERLCFNERSNPDDDELGTQIVRDLHRTGCSLFCGDDAEPNQAVLKRVLLAYARWNKNVGYCQGFNMLAALILEVMGRCEADALKVMIYLIEGVLPESYFANNLRGLSVDMAVFRELLRRRLPELSRHLEHLQLETRDAMTGASYEPPLTNVFTMQWFLTLFATCLPKNAVLRVWDLVFLEGNDVLLRAALAIWDGLADRILTVESADEFYSIMGVLTREMLEFGLMDPNHLVKTIVNLAPFPFPGLAELRDKYTYNITPWTPSVQSVSSAARRGFRLFYSDEDEDEEDAEDEDGRKMAVATAFGVPSLFKSPRRRGSMKGPSPSPSTAVAGFLTPGADRERVQLQLDIAALKKQYAKLRERQRQAHVVWTAAVKQSPKRTPTQINHLLMGKKALVSNRKAPTQQPALRLQLPPRIKTHCNRPPSPPPVATTKARIVNKVCLDNDDSSSGSTELCDDVSSDSEPEFPVVAKKQSPNLRLPEKKEKPVVKPQRIPPFLPVADHHPAPPAAREVTNINETNKKAMEIMKENTEILQRILRSNSTTQESSSERGVLTRTNSSPSTPTKPATSFHPFPVKTRPPKDAMLKLGLYQTEKNGTASRKMSQ